MGVGVGVGSGSGVGVGSGAGVGVGAGVGAGCLPLLTVSTITVPSGCMLPALGSWAITVPAAESLYTSLSWTFSFWPSSMVLASAELLPITSLTATSPALLHTTMDTVLPRATGAPLTGSWDRTVPSAFPAS